MKLDTIHYGFAAGCEAGLCPAVATLEENWGYAPGSAFGPQNFGAKPEPRAQPIRKSRLDGGAEPRLTSGGEAETDRVKFQVSACFQEALTILLSSHLLAGVEQLCNRVGIIHEGLLLYEGEPVALVAPTTKFKLKVDKTAVAFQLLEKESAISVSQNGAAYLHVNAQAEHIGELNALLVSHGIKVYELTPTQESLEEAFLRITVEKRDGDVPRQAC